MWTARSFLSTSIYDLVLLDVCHFHHNHLTVSQIMALEILALVSWISYPGIFCPKVWSRSSHLNFFKFMWTRFVCLWRQPFWVDKFFYHKCDNHNLMWSYLSKFVQLSFIARKWKKLSGPKKQMIKLECPKQHCQIANILLNYYCHEKMAIGKY